MTSADVAGSKDAGGLADDAGVDADGVPRLGVAEGDPEAGPGALDEIVGWTGVGETGPAQAVMVPATSNAAKPRLATVRLPDQRSHCRDDGWAKGFIPTD